MWIFLKFSCYLIKKNQNHKYLEAFFSLLCLRKTKLRKDKRSTKTMQQEALILLYCRIYLILYIENREWISKAECLRIGKELYRNVNDLCKRCEQTWATEKRMMLAKFTCVIDWSYTVQWPGATYWRQWERSGG